MYLLCHRMCNYIKKGSIKAALTSYNLPIINAHKFFSNKTVCNISQLQTVCRSRLRPAPPDAHSPSAFPTEWRHESTGEHAPSSRCAQLRAGGCNPGIRPSSDIPGTRLSPLRKTQRNEFVSAARCGSLSTWIRVSSAIRNFLCSSRRCRYAYTGRK